MDNSVNEKMTLEQKVADLEQRLVVLEKVEKRRKIKNIIIFSFYGLMIISMIIIVIMLYNKLKPYRETNDLLRDYFGNSDTSYDLDDYKDFFTNFFNY